MPAVFETTGFELYREPMVYMLSFHVFHKHFSNVNFISRTSAAT